MGKEQEIRLYEEALKTTKEVLDSAGVKFWLDYGTLLAAYRDKHPLEWDLQDVDVSVRKEDLTEEKLERITQKFIDKGYPVQYAKTPLTYLFQRTFKKGNIHIDLWVFHKARDYYWRTWSITSGLYIWLVCPAKYYSNLQNQTMYCGEKFWIPNQTENYLTLTYGLDWKTPIGYSYGDKFAMRTRVQYERFVDWLEGKFDEERYLRDGYK